MIDQADEKMYVTETVVKRCNGMPNDYLMRNGGLTEISGNAIHTKVLKNVYHDKSSAADKNKIKAF